jgi:lipoprotein signal peptidase
LMFWCSQSNFLVIFVHGVSWSRSHGHSNKLYGVEIFISFFLTAWCWFFVQVVLPFK